jgi:hypothetical protein
MLRPMLTRAPGRYLPAPTALLAVAASLSEASAAVSAGADLVELTGIGAGGAAPGDPERPAIAAFRARHPCVLVSAAGPAADLVRTPAVALATGAMLICDDLRAARASGLPAPRVIVEVLPDEVKAAAQQGWATLVDADHAASLASGPGGPAERAGIVAIAAISSWLGAAVVRTRYPLQVRRALDMTASILGTRPPARTVRGLA